ncbi:MAG TPA: tRNA preQ1(34) S-adenosylmethionine ribosyltransferase-isomerase QueA [Vicinamibacterales bacterium]|nr:tRNA preQ1(34) S-adenosylmethionine ribosyltransferase-isomerase QueA [Vicinamibacterales bacterium]
MLASDFDFHLPEELIAQEALPRGASRLLVLDRASGAVEHTHVTELPRLLGAGDLLVVNNTRVFAARLLGRRVPSGGAVECLLLRRLAAAPGGGETWEALMHPGQKLKAGARVRFEGAAGAIEGTVLARRFHGRRTIALAAEGGRPLDDLVDALGHVPLPPYIRRTDTTADRERYQTVFAAARGSVAAPTAGLHFDRQMLRVLADAGVGRAEITLHVGYGTFKPLRSEIVEEHVVDPEDYEISDDTATAVTAARQAGRRVVAVGTTTTRALEDAAMKHGGEVRPGRGEATAFIYPGFEFRVITGLMTNFHLPKSSLLMLVAAFAGREQVMAAYREAVERRYRFYSYGDAMLIL